MATHEAKTRHGPTGYHTGAYDIEPTKLPVKRLDQLAAMRGT